MSFNERVAILVDGEFLKKTLNKRLRVFPNAVVVLSAIDRIRQHVDVKGLDLYRVFFLLRRALRGLRHAPADQGGAQLRSFSRV